MRDFQAADCLLRECQSFRLAGSCCALEFRLLPLQLCIGDGALRLLRSSISVIGDSEDGPDRGPQLRSC